MNFQNPDSSNHIEWSRRRLADGTRLPGFTWNVGGGCLHRCRWKMPDGKIAICYAEEIADKGVAKSNFPHGFEHHYFHEKRLDEPLKLKEPAGIFLDSMSDLFGHWVPETQIQAVLDVCREAHWHTFFALTKNAPRLLKFDLPLNVWAGVSSPPDFFMGKELRRDQQSAMLFQSLTILSALRLRRKGIQWMSFEPLSWDVSEIVLKFPVGLQWAVIGAASNGRTYHAPADQALDSLLSVLDSHNVPVFFKGNLRSSPLARKKWREEFPKDNSVNVERPTLNSEHRTDEFKLE